MVVALMKPVSIRRDLRLSRIALHSMLVVLFLALFPPCSSALSDTNNPVVEMPGLFKMRRIESLEEKGFRYQIQKFWLTDNELLLSASQYRDWKAPGPWERHVFRWNIETGVITETPYVGTLLCATESRLVLRRDVPDASDPNMKKTRMVLSGAVFGEPSTPFESNAYNPYSCQPMERNIVGDFGPNTYLVPLLPGNGRLLEISNSHERSIWLLPEGSEDRIQVGRGTKNSFGEETYSNPIGHDFPTFLSWTRQYSLFGATGDHHIQRMWTYDLTLYLVSANGQIEIRHEPGWINSNKKSARLSVSFVITRTGVVWRVAGPIRGKPTPYDGLYIEKDGLLVRFLRNATLSQLDVFPGGCRALITIDPTGKNFPNDGRTELHLINFCQENPL